MKEEYATTIIDVIARRTRLAFLDTDATRACIPRVADIMAENLQWDDQKKSSEIEKANKFLESMNVTNSKQILN